MSYTPNEWDSGDVVTAVKMNALETAVGDMNMSYTPNTWSDGDILSAAKMNALEQAVASGGGGGSSDFSTVTVSVSALIGETYCHYISGGSVTLLDNNTGDETEISNVAGVLTVAISTTPTEISLLTYKGSTIIYDEVYSVSNATLVGVYYDDGIERVCSVLSNVSDSTEIVIAASF